MAEQIIDLLDNDIERHAMRKKAYIFSRDAVWKEVSRKYLQVFSEVQAKPHAEPASPALLC
jgi:glycosyltransferase involved in cell wall biosynthesis